MLAYPVADEDTPTAKNIAYCLWRDPDTLMTRTLAINPLTLSVLQLGMVEPTPTVSTLLNQLLANQPALTAYCSETATEQYAGLLNTLCKNRIILGFRPLSNY